MTAPETAGGLASSGPGAAGVRTPGIESRLMTTYSPAPVTFVRGSGCHLYDDAGREYLDFLCGIAVTSLGHAHPALSEAVCSQVRTLSHVSNLFSNALAPELAATIDRLVSDAVERVSGARPSGRVFLANSGAEANECAFKLARKHAGSGRYVIVSAEGGFHGRTFGALAATAQPEKQAPFVPLPAGFESVPVDDPSSLIAHGDASSLAAVILEPIQGENGVRDVPTELFRVAREVCDRAGAALIVDEIQTGLGRTGRWFGFEHHGVAPDVVTLAKSLGGGMPIGACWARDEIASAFSPGDHGTTFGGQPLACSAALATLAVVEGEGLVCRAGEVGARLAKSIAGLPGVSEVRGAGLLIGVGLAAGVDARSVQIAALAAGLVVNALGTSTIRIAPPFTITDEEVDDGIRRLATALSEVVEAARA